MVKHHKRCGTVVVMVVTKHKAQAPRPFVSRTAGVVMIDFQNIGTEASLATIYPQIEAFYEQELKLHRIHVSDNLFLSALELKAPAGSQGVSLDDSSNTLVIVAGRAETEHKYAELLYHLKDTGLRVIVCFVRGQGQSSMVLYDSNKCHVERFLHYRQDLENILIYLDVGPNFKLMGFSLGGLISLEFCFNTTYKYKPQSLVLIAPFLSINYPIPRKLLYSVFYPVLKVLCNIRSFALAYTPHDKEYVRIPFEENFHSHSLIRYDLYHDYYANHPQLALAGPTYKFVKCCLQAQRRLQKIKCSFNFPTLCMGAGADMVVSTKATQEFCAAHQHDPVPPRYELIPHAYHDILNEADSYRNPALIKALNFLFNGTTEVKESKNQADGANAKSQAAAAAAAKATASSK